MVLGPKLNVDQNRHCLPGVEAKTGLLGHGFPIAVGIAIAGQLAVADYRTFVLTGDGEQQEGTNWEAAMTAGHRELSNLTLIIDRNRIQQGALNDEAVSLEPLGDRYRAFGWEVTEVDGRNPLAMLNAFEAPMADCRAPLCLIADTIKGKGVSFMENKAKWRHGIPSRSECEKAVMELAL